MRGDARLSQTYITGVAELDVMVVEVAELNWRSATALAQVSKFHEYIVQRYFYEVRIPAWLRPFAPLLNKKRCLLDVLERYGWPQWRVGAIDQYVSCTFIMWRLTSSKAPGTMNIQVQLYVPEDDPAHCAELYFCIDPTGRYDLPAVELPGDCIRSATVFLKESPLLFNEFLSDADIPSLCQTILGKPTIAEWHVIIIKL